MGYSVTLHADKFEIEGNNLKMKYGSMMMNFESIDKLTFQVNDKQYVYSKVEVI